MNVNVIIPALNEERSIDLVIKEIPELVNSILVVDNGSTDKTAIAASSAGAIVLNENRKGYGYACMKGINYLNGNQRSAPGDIVVFLDGDYSDYPEDLLKVIQPLIENKADLVIGSRNNSKRERGSMTVQQELGNWLATKMIYFLYGFRYSDLGPFRAINFEKLISLNMKDKTYGWTVEMQIKALRKKLRVMEVPVRYRKRIGKSKVSGTVKGSLSAGYKIIHTILKYSIA